MPSEMLIINYTFLWLHSWDLKIKVGKSQCLFIIPLFIGIKKCSKTK